LRAAVFRMSAAELSPALQVATAAAERTALKTH
jgi:hypothetical protein